MICCTFAGHRNVFHPGIQNRVEEFIDELLRADDSFCFYSGGMGEFDRLCGSVVRSAKTRHPEKSIRLVLVSPYMKQSINTQSEYLPMFYDEVVIPEVSAIAHFKQAIGIRNRWMVEQSQFVISYVHLEHGGAYETVKYAKKIGRMVLDVLCS